MNMNLESAAGLIDGIREIYSQTGNRTLVEVVVCPPFPFLSLACSRLEGTGIGVGAQNVHQEASGAYTGEVSASMIKSAGCSHVIIGHSERRQYFYESDELVNKKLRAALNAGLLPIVCVGETLQEREDDQTLEVVERQVRGALREIPESAMQHIVLAYEPVWAIGTGKTATPEQAQEVHAEIRRMILEIFSAKTASEIRIQYGGSMKPENARELLLQPDVDGGLIGGACLKSDSFASIFIDAIRIAFERG